MFDAVFLLGSVNSKVVYCSLMTAIHIKPVAQKVQTSVVSAHKLVDKVDNWLFHVRGQG